MATLETLRNLDARYPALPGLCPEGGSTAILRVEAREVLKGLFPPGDFFIASDDGTPNIGHPFRRDLPKLQDYLRQRTIYSSQSGGHIFAYRSILQNNFSWASIFPSFLSCGVIRDRPLELAARRA